MRLHARLLGFGEAESSFHVAPGQTVRVEVRLGTTPIPLDPIVVTATSADRRVGRLDDFHYRSRRGWATFIMQDEIERRVLTRVSAMIAEHGFDVFSAPARTGGILNRRYACPPQVPGEFGGSNARCGVIAIWTRGR